MLVLTCQNHFSMFQAYLIQDLIENYQISFLNINSAHYSKNSHEKISMGD